MRLLIYGICMHIAREGQQHLIALPAGTGYEIDDENGRPIKVPDHTASLSIRYDDIDADDRETAIRTFQDGGGLEPISPTPGNRSWKLDGVILRCDVAGQLDLGDVGCVPRLTATMSQLQLLPKVEAGQHTKEVAAYMVVSGGTLVARVEKAGGRHTWLTAGNEGWSLAARYGDTGPIRTLPMKGAAEVTLANHEASSCNPCSEYDYLLHYRLTRSAFLPREYFQAPLCVPTPDFDPRRFPLPEGDVTSTLLSCSNSTYP